jgi:threonine aldolase
VACIAVENTHMVSGGRATPADALAAVAAHGPPVHLDGARLFNAEVSLGVPVAHLAAAATTVTCCLSKGLGAPVGSVLAGPVDLIGEARVQRGRLGGGMRQAGILAAAGLVALEQMVERLADDHARARRLAAAVGERFADAVDPASVDTNVVVFTPPDPDGVVEALSESGVRTARLGRRGVRMVTHLDVDEAGIDRACAALAGLA